MMMLKHLSSNTEATFEAQFKRKLSNTDAQLKKSVVYKKRRVIIRVSYNYRNFNFLVKCISWSSRFV